MMYGNHNGTNNVTIKHTYLVLDNMSYLAYTSSCVFLNIKMIYLHHSRRGFN